MKQTLQIFFNRPFFRIIPFIIWELIRLFPASIAAIITALLLPYVIAWWVLWITNLFAPFFIIVSGLGTDIVRNIIYDNYSKAVERITAKLDSLDAAKDSSSNADTKETDHE